MLNTWRLSVEQLIFSTIHSDYNVWMTEIVLKWLNAFVVNDLCFVSLQTMYCCVFYYCLQKFNLKENCEMHKKLKIFLKFVIFLLFLSLMVAFSNISMVILPQYLTQVRSELNILLAN